MGDPRKIRKKYETPTHPWQKDRIDEEKTLTIEFGLKNKKEIWRMETLLKKFKDQVKALASRIDEQSKLEEKQLVNRLLSLGLITKEDPLDTVLGLGIRDVLERRLQTIIVRKGLAKTMKQSRQFITHGHVIVDNKKITFPSYIISLKEESLLEFIPTSTLSNVDHPERMIKEVSKDKLDKKKKEKKEEVAPPTFSPEEIAQIEEKGAIEKKKAEEKAEANKEKVKLAEKKKAPSASEAQDSKKEAPKKEEQNPEGDKK